MNILGFSCFNHDSAACLLRGGQLVAAVEEERLTRVKHDDRFPTLAIQSVLAQGGLTGADLDAVVFYEEPAPDTDLAETLPALLAEACGYHGALSFCDHHRAHAAFSYYGSLFDHAAVLTIDDTGGAGTTSLYVGRGRDLTLINATPHPHSLGLLYAAMTEYLGFETFEGEYKAMGLAAYGKPLYGEALQKLVSLQEDGGFCLDLSFFDFEASPLFTDKLVALLGPPRRPEAPMESRFADIAASLQKLIEDVLLHLVRAAKNQTGAPDLCLSGSLGHNVVANSLIAQSGLFDHVHIPFACGNNGAAIGAAVDAHIQNGGERSALRNPSPYLGADYTDQEIEAALKQHNCVYEKLEAKALLAKTAALLAQNRVVGWFQGRMEFGPRALGNRSLLASASGTAMKDLLNERVKHRETFRPFAPAVIAEKAGEYFDLPDSLSGHSPHMLYAATVRPEKRAAIPAVTHEDGSARPQTVAHENNPLFYDLLRQYEALTGIPILINTSFNVRGEPIVASPADALRCFQSTGIDALAMGCFLVRKS
ncbi:MAG TPA: hypothetical protein DCY07_01850 [Rhodospirillaceae bacterium]|nr:hypothetical protein [Rhodospirillaceae bacterium]